jgi:hypothetical protein
MLKQTESVKVYLACGSADMRKSIDGLAVIVQESFKLDPFSTALYVFCNKGCNKLKIIAYSILEFDFKSWNGFSKEGDRQMAIARKEIEWIKKS